LLVIFAGLWIVESTFIEELRHALQSLAAMVGARE
jgi:hypothetical protein